MKIIGSSFKFRMGAILAGLIMLVILDGCVKVHIATNVGDCPTVNGKKDPDPTGCNIVPWSGDAYLFINKQTGSQITDHNHICNGTTKQKCLTGNPGQCGFRASSCKQNFYPTTPGSMGGSCKCECT